MKKQLLFASSLLLAGSLFITSCKKDDVSQPSVTINGSDMTVSLQGTYSEPGATANDDKDGSITPSASGSVNTNLKGVYEITYTATDAAGNSGTATRRVTVVNDVDNVNGTYNVAGGPAVGTGGTYTYTQTIAASNSVNNRIVFGKLGNYAGNNTIYANIIGSNVTIPSQTTPLAVGTGSNATVRTFSGNNGTRSASSVSITYAETAGGSTASYSEFMTKQ